jgi:beta-glucanase (GH16 family)
MTNPLALRHIKRFAVISVVAGSITLPLLQAGSSSAAAATPAPVGSSGGSNLIFSDEFNGTSLNSSTWRTCSWWADTTCSIESNAEQELYTPNNVTVANGALKLQARKENAVAWNGKTYNYTSGMVSTGGRSGSVAPGFTYKYGYAEARVKIPAGQGMWPAFWTLPSNYSWPPEIDAMEILGNQPNVTNMTYHYADAAGADKSSGTAWAGPDFSADWHVFGVDWEPNAIVWYVDGVERARFTDASAITAVPQYLLLNLAVGGNWPGSPNASTAFPSDYLVDYVRVWDGFGTPGGAPTPPPPSSGYAAAVAADGPVSDWRLGETTGTTAADSVGTNPGAYTNGVTLGAPSLVAADTANPAASFDGVNDSVAVQSSAGLSPAGAVTVEAWVRPSALPAAGTFASVATKAESYALQFNGPQLEFTTMQAGARRRVQAPAGAVVAGQTYHVVGTYDGTTQRLFVNGAQVASAAFSGAMSVNTNRVVLGSWDTASEFLSGTIDEVAVYGKALSAAQVANHFNQGAGSATPPPAPVQRTLTVSRAGTGSGSVTSSPAGINCGTTCSTTVADGTTVTMAQAPAAGSTFAGWSGGCSGTGTCTTTLTANTAVTATFTATPPPASGYRAAVTGDGPVSYWRLGETSGTSAADTTGADTGTYRNGVALAAAGLTSDSADRAATFDGVNDSVAAASTAGLSPANTVTVEAWVRPSALPAAGSFASIASKAESYTLQFNGNRLEFTTMQSGTRRRVQAAAGAVVAGQSYHVVGTYDGATQRLYVNGVQVASAAFAGPMSVNTNRVVLGSWDTASEFLAGTIDDVAVYNKVLTAAQIANHYSQGRAS